MLNVDIKTDKDGIMTLRVDTKQEHGKSSSGKTTKVASTNGFVNVGDVMVSLNVNKK